MIHYRILNIPQSYPFYRKAPIDSFRRGVPNARPWDADEQWHEQATV